MKKPQYLLPFIFIYKLVFFIIKLPIKLIKHFSLGLFFTSWYLISAILNLLIRVFTLFTLGCRCWYKLVKILGKIFTYISFGVYKLIKYLVFGCIYPFVILYNLIFGLIGYIKQIVIRYKDKNKNKYEAKERARKAKEEARLRKYEQEQLAKVKKEKQEEREAIKQANLEAAKRKKKEEDNTKDFYINRSVNIKKPGLFTRISNWYKGVVAHFKNKYNNSTMVKNARNKNDINRQVLLINFEGEDAEKSEIKIVYQYIAKTPEGKVVKGYLEAFSKVEVHSFLLSEGYEVYSIKTSKLIQLTHPNMSKSGGKIKNKDLIFMLTQLSTYIKAGIPLVDSLKILTRQYKNKTYQKIFRTIIYDLSMGDNFSDALSKQGTAFPRLLINMIKASEMTGELPEALDDMAEYFTETEKTRKQMVSAMTYPAIILVIAVGVIVFVMLYVIPKFVDLYKNMDNAQLPGFTVLVMNISDFLKNYFVFIFIGLIIFIIVFAILYKNVKSFKTVVQWTLMHMPIFGNVIIYNEVTMFTKTFASLLKHNVFITDSMEILNKISNNEIYKMYILDTITNLARGEKISLAFKDQWAFPIPAYEMIVTGERTGQLAEMMQKVSIYYQELHTNAVARIKTFIEPALIIMLTGAVGAIVMAIVIPMFDMYSNLGI